MTEVVNDPKQVITSTGSPDDAAQPADTPARPAEDNNYIQFNSSFWVDANSAPGITYNNLTYSLFPLGKGMSAGPTANFSTTDFKDFAIQAGPVLAWSDETNEIYARFLAGVGSTKEPSPSYMVLLGSYNAITSDGWDNIFLNPELQYLSDDRSLTAGLYAYLPLKVAENFTPSLMIGGYGTRTFSDRSWRGGLIIGVNFEIDIEK